jgi:hypothetical protein
MFTYYAHKKRTKPLRVVESYWKSDGYSLCMLRRRMEEWGYFFLTPALNEGEWSASRSGVFIPAESLRYSLNRRLGGAQSQSGRSGGRKDLLSLTGIEPVSRKLCTIQLADKSIRSFIIPLSKHIKTSFFKVKQVHGASFHTSTPDE